MQIQTKIIRSTDLTVSVALYIDRRHTGNLQLDRSSYSKLLERLGVIFSTTEQSAVLGRCVKTVEELPTPTKSVVFRGTKKELDILLDQGDQNEDIA